MLAMDSGRCTPLAGEKLPAECYQFNGENKQPNLGPFVGGTDKSDSDRAPYSNNIWFSFPNSCPTKTWADKTDECRSSTRRGLCDIDTAPDGVTCTFSYNILGWVPIDDVVGITAIPNPQTGSKFTNFTEWCASKNDNVEFVAGSDHKMTGGLEFWKDPLNKTANAARTQTMIDVYAQLVDGKIKSPQIKGTDLAAMKKLPEVSALAAKNPPCYKSVPNCNTAPGCKRTGYSQICAKCEAGENCKTDASFKFPTLAKAPTPLSEEETKSSQEYLNTGFDKKKSDGKSGGNKASSAIQATAAFATIFASLFFSAFAL